MLSPTKRVLLPDLRAGCSLADTITRDDVRVWKAQFPDHITVGYVNTTAAVKAELDYCCTSGNVLAIIDAIPEDRGILFLPDFFLGAHVKRLRPNRRVEVWMGECHVHAGRITSSPGPIPNAAIATCSAAVPELTASEYFTPMRLANSISNVDTFEGGFVPGRPYQRKAFPLRITSSTCPSSRSS